MDPVSTNTDQYHPILTQYYQVTTSTTPTQLLQVPTSNALYWPSVTKYQAAFERISTCRYFLNLTTYQFTSGVEFDQGYLSFLIFAFAFSCTASASLMTLTKTFTSLVSGYPMLQMGNYEKLSSLTEQIYKADLCTGSLS